MPSHEGRCPTCQQQTAFGHRTQVEVISEIAVAEAARLRVELADLRSRVAAFSERLQREVARLDAAMVGLFGAPAAEISVPHIDHLCLTMTPQHVEQLLRAVGGPWEELLVRVALKRAQAAVARTQAAPKPAPAIFQTSGRAEE